MTTRVTNEMLRQGALLGLTNNAAALSRIQERVATGKQLNRPSDDPANVRTAVKLRDSIAALDQYQRNIDMATATLSTAESALGSGGDLLQRARELAVQGANGSLSASERLAMSQEASAIADQLVQLAGTKVGESYVFSGYQTGTAPYASAAGAYQGDAGAIMARIGPGQTVQLNVAGDVAFGAALAAVTQLQTALAGGGPVPGATITALDVGSDAMMTARASLGARQNRLDTTKSELDTSIISARGLLSSLEDIDPTTAITELNTRQTAYEAALRVNAQILNHTLFDVL